MDTTLESIESEERPQEMRQWFVECPLEEGLAEADIAVRPIPYGMFSVILWEIKTLQLLAEESRLRPKMH